jgi:hypothetical protein
MLDHAPAQADDVHVPGINDMLNRTFNGLSGLIDNRPCFWLTAYGLFI